jgi:hypothetical protein
MGVEARIEEPGFNADRGRRGSCRRLRSPRSSSRSPTATDAGSSPCWRPPRISKIAAAAGAKKVRIAKSDEVERATGFVAGAVAPFPLPNVDRVFVDRGLLAHKRVWIGAGSPSHMAMIAPGDMIRLARAQPMDAVEAAT